MRDTDNPFESEFDVQQAETGDEENVTKTGTTTVGISASNGVAVATDRRASLAGRFVASKDVVKVQEVHPTAVVTLVGSVGGAQSYADQLRAQTSLYESRRDERMSMEALSHFAARMARGGPFMRINPILAGVDEEGSHVFTIDPAGGVMEEDYTTTGSGMQVAYGVLEREYEDDLTVDEALSVASRAVESAAERDTGSGNGLATARVTEEGVEINKYDDYSVVDSL
jgi:proteasome beta subunit